jgi:hypothetical protein
VGWTCSKDGKGKCHKMLVDKPFAIQTRRRNDNIKLDLRVAVRMKYG